MTKVLYDPHPIRGTIKKKNARVTFDRRTWNGLKAYYKYRCVRCARKENPNDPSSILTVDHIVPLAQGGSKGLHNVQPLCFPCNQWKGERILDFRRKFKN